jgi:hypothetical protein
MSRSAVLQRQFDVFVEGLLSQYKEGETLLLTREEYKSALQHTIDVAISLHQDYQKHKIGQALAKARGEK